MRWKPRTLARAHGEADPPADVLFAASGDPGVFTRETDEWLAVWRWVPDEADEAIAGSLLPPAAACRRHGGRGDVISRLEGSPVLQAGPAMLPAQLDRAVRIAPANPGGLRWPSQDRFRTASRP